MTISACPNPFPPLLFAFPAWLAAPQCWTRAAHANMVVGQVAGAARQSVRTHAMRTHHEVSAATWRSLTTTHCHDWRGAGMRHMTRTCSSREPCRAGGRNRRTIDLVWRAESGVSARAGVRLLVMMPRGATHGGGGSASLVMTCDMVGEVGLAE